MDIYFTSGIEISKMIGKDELKFYIIAEIRITDVWQFSVCWRWRTTLKIFHVLKFFNFLIIFIQAHPCTVQTTAVIVPS